MCGILGIVADTFAAESIAPLLRQVIGDNALRGPDGVSVWSHGPCTMAHQLLAIGASPAQSRQPLCLGQYAMVYNGEFLVSPGQGQRTRVPGPADGARFLESWASMTYTPEALLRDTVGPFAGAIWDGASLHLFRDHLGQKPLYYWTTENVVVFGSRLDWVAKILDALALAPLHLSGEALRAWAMQGYCAAPQTLLQNVRAICPAEYLAWRGQTLRRSTYWQLPTLTGSRKPGVQQIDALLDETLLTAQVHRGGGAVGLMLSGGLDSANLAVRMAPVDVKAACVSFSRLGRQDYDEAKQARSIANDVGFSLDVHRLLECDIDNELGRILASVDQPIADPSMVPTYFAAGAASRLSAGRVALTGDGADELFAGYETFLAEGLHGLVPRRMPTFHQGKRHKDNYYSLGSRIARFRAGDTFSLVARHLVWLAPDPFLTAQMVTQDIASNPQALRDLYVRGWLAECLLRKTDGVSVAQGMEFRSPYLDYRWWDTVGGSWHIWLQGFGIKSVLRQALLRRRKSWSMLRTATARKHGFGFPVQTYMQRSSHKKSLETWMKIGATVLLENDVPLSNTMLSTTTGSPRFLWGLVVLGAWLERNGYS